MSGIQEFLRKLAEQGEHDSSGRFTLDLARARDKLGGYRMARADRYLVAFTLAAMQMGARKFHLRSGLGTLQLDWDGSPLEAETSNSQRLWSSSQAGVATLLLGLQTALSGPVRLARWQASPNHQWTFTRGRELWKSKPVPTDSAHRLTLWLQRGLLDRLWHKLHSIPSAAEVQWAQEVGLAGNWVDVGWNEQPQKRTLEVTRTRAFAFPGVPEEMQLPVHFQRPPLVSEPVEELAGFAYFGSSARRPTRVCWHLYGLSMGEQKVPGFLPGLVVHLNSHHLEPDLSLTQLVDREPRQQALSRLMGQLLTLLEQHPGWPTPGYLYFSSSPPPPAYLQTLFITRLLPLLARQWPAEAEGVIRQQILAFLARNEGEAKLDMWESFPLLACWVDWGPPRYESLVNIRQRAEGWGLAYFRNAPFRDREPLPHEQMPPVLRLPKETHRALQQWLNLPLLSCPDSHDPCWHQLRGRQGFLRLVWRRGFRFVGGVPAARADQQGHWQPCPPHYPPGLRVLEATTDEEILALMAELWSAGEGEHLREQVLPYLALLGAVGARYPTTLPPAELHAWGFSELEQELLHCGAIRDRPGRFEPWQRKALEGYFGPLHVVAPDEVSEWVLEFELNWRRSHCRLGLPVDLTAPDHQLQGQLLLGTQAQPAELSAELGFGPLQLSGQTQDLRAADLLRKTPLLRQFLQQVRQRASEVLEEAAETLSTRPALQLEPLQRALWSLMIWQMQAEPAWETLQLSRKAIFQSGDGAWRDLRYLEYLRAQGRLRIWSQQPQAPGPAEDCWLVPARWIFLAHRLLAALEARRTSQADL